MPKRRLEGSEIRKIANVLQNRFSISSIGTFTKSKMDEDYYDYVAPIAGLKDGIFQFVDAMNRDWKHYKLIEAYLDEYPDDPEMLECKTELEKSTGSNTGNTSEASSKPAVSLEQINATKTKVRDLIARARLGDALKHLDAFSQKINNVELSDEVTALTSKYNKLNRDERIGILTSQEIRVETAKIVNAVLRLLNDLENYSK